MFVRHDNTLSLHPILLESNCIISYLHYANLLYRIYGIV